MMIKWKKVLAAGLGTAMLLSQTAYADTVMVPPPPFIGGSQTGNTGLGNGIVQPGVTGGQNNSAENQGGPGGAGGQSSTENQGGPGVSGNQSGSQSSSSHAQEAALPQVKAEGAVLMDAATGKVLFGKNQDMQFYPASITKVMTALLVLERCSLNDTVTFSASATTNLESGAVSLGISEGDQLTVEQCLYGLLLKSANEIGNGLAEHVAGSVSAFADLMNARARELGCKNTHFTNPHGLNDTAHKTTPYDMALIMRAALQNETFRKIDTTTSYEFPATKKSAAKTITMGHKMMYPTDSRYYEGIIGGKTGYTSKAGNTLVTGAQRNGVRLIAVVMKASGSHYTDTIAMLDYGFANYEKLAGGSQNGVVTPGAGNQSGTVIPGTGSQNGAATPGTGSQSGVVTPGAGNQSGAVIPGNGNSQGTQEVPGTSSGPSGIPSQNTSSVPGESGSAGPGSQTGIPEGSGSSQGWKQDQTGWYYIGENGSNVANQWLELQGTWYWFDGNGYMATGWRNYTDGSYYYFDPATGAMVSDRWIQDGGAWYYLSADGKLLTNGTTPDGYHVNEYGIWDEKTGA